MEAPQGSITDQLQQQLSRRGWAVASIGSVLTAHKHDWPAQLKVVVDPGDGDSPAMIGLLLDFRSMPLQGERFRDIFNSELDTVLRSMGSFVARQMRGDAGWSSGVSDQVFLGGVNRGVSRSADMVLFDRCPNERGEDILERFNLESNRLLEAGGEIAILLQRTYNRTVLRSDRPVSTLPDVVAPALAPTAPAVVGEGSYPWLR